MCVCMGGDAWGPRGRRGGDGGAARQRQCQGTHVPAQRERGPCCQGRAAFSVTSRAVCQGLRGPRRSHRHGCVGLPQGLRGSGRRRFPGGAACPTSSPAPLHALARHSGQSHTSARLRPSSRGRHSITGTNCTRTRAEASSSAIQASSAGGGGGGGAGRLDAAQAEHGALHGTHRYAAFPAGRGRGAPHPRVRCSQARRPPRPPCRACRVSRMANGAMARWRIAPPRVNTCVLAVGAGACVGGRASCHATHISGAGEWVTRACWTSRSPAPPRSTSHDCPMPWCLRLRSACRGSGV